MDFSQNVKQVLNKLIVIDKVITQSELAKRVNVSPAAVTKWINGGNIEMGKLPLVAEALGISLSELFGLPNASVSQSDLEILNKVKSNPELMKILEKY